MNILFLRKIFSYFKSPIDFRLWTRFGFYIFAASLPFTLAIPQFGIAIAFIGWLCEGLIRKHWQIRWHVFLLPMLIYLGWNVITSLAPLWHLLTGNSIKYALSPSPWTTLYNVIENQWMLVIMLFMYWTIEETKTLIKICATLLISSVIPMIYGIWQIFGGIEYYYNVHLDSEGSLFRAVGFHENALTFSGLTMIILLFSFSIAMISSKKIRISLLMLTLISAFATFGTFARSIYAALAINLPIFGFMKGKKFGILVTSVLLVILLGVFSFSSTFRERVTSNSSSSKINVRPLLWKTTYGMIKDYPIFGIGEDNWCYYFNYYRVEGYYDTNTHAHNNYLTVAAQQGIPGLIIFVWMWIVAVRTGFKTIRKAVNQRTKAIVQGATLALLVFLLGCFYQNFYTTFYNSLEWWFLMGLILSCDYLTLKEEK